MEGPKMDDSRPYDRAATGDVRAVVCVYREPRVEHGSEVVNDLGRQDDIERAKSTRAVHVQWEEGGVRLV